jgi:HEAT repeat protein
VNEALSVLIEQLRHQNRDVRTVAALSLGKAANTSAAGALVRALAAEPDFFIREYITWSLVRLGDAAVLPLIAMLNHERPVARQSAAHTLSKIGDARARDALIDALKDHHVGVVSKAASALGKIGDTKAIPVLISLLGHEDTELQATLVSVLEEFGLPTVQPLVHALTHDDWRIREQAADLLRLIGSPDAVPALIDISNDRHWQVRFAVVHALGRLGGPKAQETVQAMRQDSHTLVRALVPKMMSCMTG